MRLHKVTLLLGLVALTLVLSRCGKQTATPGTFSHVYTVTLATACIECHVPGGNATVRNVTFDVTTQAKAYSTLLAAVVNGNTSKPKCPPTSGTVKLVEPGDPSTSFLVGSLFSDYKKMANYAGIATCATYPHDVDITLSATEKQSILDWITSGAKND